MPKIIFTDIEKIREKQVTGVGRKPQRFIDLRVI